MVLVPVKLSGRVEIVCFQTQRPAHRVVVEDGDRRGKFVENIRALPIRVERHVPRSRARSDRRKRHRVRR